MGAVLLLIMGSQGAQVVHRASKLLDVALYHFIHAIVVFGDPFNFQRFQGSLNDMVLRFCHLVRATQLLVCNTLAAIDTNKCIYAGRSYM